MLQLIVNHFQVNSGHQKAIAFSAIAFIAITAKSLLLGWQEGHPACKN